MNKKDFQLKGYEDMELSTQLIIKESIKREVKVEIVDRGGQVIKLSKKNKSEYLKEATKTSADSYITSIILGDKHLSKKLLSEKRIRVPKGEKYQSEKIALENYHLYKKGEWVIKPTTTNFGIGITLMKKEGNKNEYKKAVKNAFKYDKSILIEEFIPGIECRFLIIDGTCRAVLNREPANVIGDGKRTINELINKKNNDPRRGRGYKTPLEFLQKTEIEKEVLAEKKLTFDSIPEKGEKIFIRKNSNISTGGDSIDFTDKVHSSYKEIAEKASEAINAKICGVDMIISESDKKARKDNHAIIELNYNPVLYFHDFPYIGKNRNTAQYILDLLGF